MVVQSAQENDSSGMDRDEQDQESYHARLTAFFWAHDPRRVDKVDEILLQHKDKEEAFIQRVHREFGVRDFSGELAIDDLYEHQRYSWLTFSWGSSYPGHLLPTDRRRWSGLHGTPSHQGRAKVEPQLPVNWQWTSEWTVDTASSNCDADGWSYAFDFTNLNFLATKNGGRKEPKATDYVRRRRWIRTRERVLPQVTPPSAPSSSSTSNGDDPAAVTTEQDTNKTFTTTTSSRTRNNNEERDQDLEDLWIPGSLDVDDEEGDDPGDPDEDNDEQDMDPNSSVPGATGQRAALQPPNAGTTRANGERETSPTKPPTVASLTSFSLAMDKPAVDAAWTMAVKNLETIYAQAKSHRALRKKRWTVKKEKIQQQIHLLEKTIASMQLFVHDEQLRRRHSSSHLAKDKDKQTPAPAPLFSPDGKSSHHHHVPSNATASRVSRNDTSGINLASKLKCAQSKLDALKRLFWHPREKDYTLRFSIDGIFYGLRDFLVESFKSSFAIHMSHQSNGAQGITPVCKLILKGHTVVCGKHVKVVGEKGTIVPKSLWDLMYLDTDFEITLYLIYVDDVEKDRNPWLADKPTGKWEFLFAPESTRVELTNFTRRTKGGMDLPEPAVRKLMSDVLSALVRDLALLYFPQELAMVFDAPPAKLDMEGEIEINGVSIDRVMEREMELMSGELRKPKPQRPPTPPAPPSSPDAGVAPRTSPAASPTTTTEASSAKHHALSPTAVATAPFIAVAAVASATVNLLIASDTEECMHQIAELLQLTPAQLNLLVALRQCGLYAAPYSFRSVASICDYYNAFFSNKEQDEAGAAHVQLLRATWRQLLELVYIRKTKAQRNKPVAASSSSTSALPAAALKYELFDMDAFFDRIAVLTKKPVQVKISMARFNCTVNAMSVVDAMAQLFERVVLGIDYSKPREEKQTQRTIYGFRFGRKPTVSTAAAMATHAQSAQLLDPTIHLQMDASFRSRLKAFSKFCRAMKGAIELLKRNLDTLSVEITGHVQGTGSDCAVRGSFRELAFAGPVNLALHVPALALGIYRVKTIALSDDRIGLQIELLRPHQKKNKTNNRNHDDRVVFRAMLTDFSTDVLLDVDALIAAHHTRSLSNAMERTAPWSPSASFARQVETEKTHEKHPALSLSVHSTTRGGAAGSSADGMGLYDDTDDMEHVVRIPSPTSRTTQAYGKIRVASSAFTKLHVQAKSGSFATTILPLFDMCVAFARPFFLEAFPEHHVLFDRLHTCVLRWLCAQELSVDVDFLVKSFLHHVATTSQPPSTPPAPAATQTELLFFTVCGSPGHPTPMVYRDELHLLDVILQGDDLVNIWIDDRYPPYSNPLYF